jgi:hypothetical protein
VAVTRILPDMRECSLFPLACSPSRLQDSIYPKVYSICCDDRGRRVGGPWFIARPTADHHSWNSNSKRSESWFLSSMSLPLVDVMSATRWISCDSTLFDG